MKVIRWIQNFAAVAALFAAVSMVDKLDVPFRDACVASILVILVMALLLGRVLEEEKRSE